MVTQLSSLSVSLGDMASQLRESSDLSWTGDDEDGATLYEALKPADQAGIQAVVDAKGAVDGLIDSLGTTAGLWNNTEGANVELNG
jgi:hypothetical protein